MKTEVAIVAFIKQFFYFSVKEFMSCAKISCTILPRFYGSLAVLVEFDVQYFA